MSDGDASRVLRITGGNVAITNLTIRDGRVSGNGAGVHLAAGSLALSNSTVSGNDLNAGFNLGGGIYVASGAAATLTNVTVSGNTTSYDGGGIYSAGTLSVVNSTITANTANGGGGLMSGGGGSATLRSTIVVGNSAPYDGSSNCYFVTSITSAGYNLFGSTSYCTIANAAQTGDQLDAVVALGPLADNGGPTLTHAPLGNSLALNRIPAPGNGAPAADQRGTARPRGANTDVGAVEGNAAPIITEGASVGVTMSEDASPTAFSLTLNASDADDATLTWSVQSQAGDGTASASGTGGSKAIGYTPDANFSGADSFVVRVTDSQGASDDITVNVTVNPVNDAPVASDGTLTTNEDTAGSGTLSAIDSDSASLSYAIVTNGTKGTATITNAATGAYSYTPNANANGADSFTFQAYDGLALDFDGANDYAIAPLNGTALTQLTVEMWVRPTSSTSRGIFQWASVLSATGPFVYFLDDGANIQMYVDGNYVMSTPLPRNSWTHIADAAPAASTTATSASPAGSYAITVSGGADANYSFVYVPGTLTVEPGSAQVVRLFLPMLAVAPPSPTPTPGSDLVVAELRSENGELELVVVNQGDTAVTAAFWVDLAIAPAQAPAAPNDTWELMGTRGMSWGVTAPLAPGAALTLRPGDSYYRPDVSYWGGTIAGGKPLYAHVDSANANTDYGAVLEGHEAAGEAYNNVEAGVAASTLEPPTAPASAGQAAGGLPARPE